jgi:hypothetical protein
MKLHDTEKQLILYTKGHFGKIDYEHDLKYFAADLYGLFPEYVEWYSVFNMVVKLYQKLVDEGFIDFKLINFLSETFRRAYREDNTDKVDWMIVIRQMLAEIQGMAVCEGENVLIELGRADLSLIPGDDE